MKNVTPSIFTLLMALGLIAVGATGAFFSDTETTGGTFAAGVIDLMVGNESYYNGNACRDEDPSPNAEDWRWQGTAAYPVPGTSCTLSWVDGTKSVLGRLFFAFADLKPDDEGEDTISLTVDTNDAWACMEVSLTSDDDISSDEPELDAGDAAEDGGDVWDGELARRVHVLWWADDGDNVLEDDEYPARTLSSGVRTLYDLARSSGPFRVALADSVTNVWTGTAGPLRAGETYHIGKAWCFGVLTPEPLPAGTGVDPTVHPGLSCDGSMLSNVNLLQTDGVTLDVSFVARQARHDSAYVCPEPYEPPVPCDTSESYADEVVAIDQGRRAGGSIVPLARSGVATVLGAPYQTNTGDVDSGIPVGTFLSLGFATSSFVSAIGPSDGSASIVLAFNDNVVVDGPGIDLRLFEVTNGSYPDEYVKVEVANVANGPWYSVATSVTRNAGIDLASAGVGMAWRYVRITEVSDSTVFPSDGDGYDLDAVQALNCIVSPVR